MTIKERILSTIEVATGPLCDDCLTKVANLTRRQDAFSVCTELKAQGKISRDQKACTMCAKVKNASWKLGMDAMPITASVSVAVQERPWYWEGNVQVQITRHLASQGYIIQSVADTAAKSHGKDIVAVRPDGSPLWVSVKGYPEKSPSVQSRHWFSGAVFDLLLYRNEDPSVQLALGLPDGYTTYHSLFKRIAWLRLPMPFRIFWVKENGEVWEE
jgi:hypothetical protein